MVDPPRRLLLIVAVVIASALVIVLTLQKRTLAERAEAFARRANDLYPGLYLPPLTLPTLAGERAELAADARDRPQLLFVFNTTCEFCLASLPAWRDLAARLSDQADVYGVSLHDSALTRAYADTHHLLFPIALMSDARSRALYRTRSVPQTVVLDATGLVRYARTGALKHSGALDSIIVAVGRAAAPLDTSTVGGPNC